MNDARVDELMVAVIGNGQFLAQVMWVKLLTVDMFTYMAGVLTDDRCKGT